MSAIIVLTEDYRKSRVIDEFRRSCYSDREVIYKLCLIFLILFC